MKRKYRQSNLTPRKRRTIRVGASARRWSNPDTSSVENVRQVVEMTHQDKIKMYNKVKKADLIEMLIAANTAINLLQLSLNAHNYPTTQS